MAEQLTMRQFLKRYPPHGRTNDRNRVLAKCECERSGCHGWAYAFADDLSPWETPVEPQPGIMRGE